MVNIEQKKGERRTAELWKLLTASRVPCLSYLVRLQSAALFKMLCRNKWTIRVGLKSAVFNK